jgi:addiction module RelE/StbE family toxin
VNLEWTEPAREDLRNIRRYISQDSEYYAERFAARLVEAVERLVAFPNMGRAVPEAKRSDTREIIVHNYRVMYRSEPDRVLILAIVHCARDWSRNMSQPWNLS